MIFEKRFHLCISSSFCIQLQGKNTYLKPTKKMRNDQLISYFFAKLFFILLELNGDRYAADDGDVIAGDDSESS
ncbi:hypothetical protein BPJM79_30342 [Bacillus pumilus]